MGKPEDKQAKEWETLLGAHKVAQLKRAIETADGFDLIVDDLATTWERLRGTFNQLKATYHDCETINGDQNPSGLKIQLALLKTQVESFIDTREKANAMTGKSLQQDPLLQHFRALQDLVRGRFEACQLKEMQAAGLVAGGASRMFDEKRVATILQQETASPERIKQLQDRIRLDWDARQPVTSFAKLRENLQSPVSKPEVKERGAVVRAQNAKKNKGSNR
jgi:hypothetical protein